MRGRVTNTGYLDNSPDRFNDYNVIPGPSITMDGVSKPILMFPIKNNRVGNPVQGIPGENYYFPEAQGVVEMPLPQGNMSYERMAKGGSSEAKMRDILSKVAYGRGGSTMTPELAAKILKTGSIYGKSITSSQRSKFAELAAEIGIDENGDPIEKNKDTSEDVEEYRRGGSLPKAKKKHSKTTNKNIYTAINELFTRNTMLYGSGGKEFYKPELKHGGWLDAYDDGGEGPPSTLDIIKRRKIQQAMADEAARRKGVVALPDITRVNIPDEKIIEAKAKPKATVKGTNIPIKQQAQLKPSYKTEEQRIEDEARGNYIENPTFMDYLGQAGYMPLLAMSDPFSMGENLKSLRQSQSDPRLSAAQKFSQGMDIANEAVPGALLNVATEGIGEGLLPGVVNKFTKAPQMMKNLYKDIPLAPTAPNLNVKSTSPVTPSSPWSIQELPGLHLKSTMTDGAVTKIVEPKTGLINTEQALAIIAKESGGKEKVQLIKQALGDNIPKKMDYNDFRKTVQDQLIPLERQFSTARSDYGLQDIGYVDRKVVNGVTTDTTSPDLLENQTLILGNKGKFGRGSSAHGNPDETLGHIHFLRDVETPDVLTVTQIQSDAFQGTHRTSLKTKDQAKFSYDKQLEYYNKNKEKLEGITQLPDGSYQFADGQKISKGAYENMFSGIKESLDLSKADLENFTQKSLLDKNHQERYLQELVNYAGERGDINKLRLPTSETSAKVQNYRPKTKWNMQYNDGDDVVLLNGEKGKILDSTFDNSVDIQKENGEIVNLDFTTGGYSGKANPPIKSLNNQEVKFIRKYDPEHQTILKKYDEQPKMIKKLFGVEPKIVTDNKGNSWYEFDIPKSFREKKGEIKAFKTGGWLDSYQ